MIYLIILLSYLGSIGITLGVRLINKLILIIDLSKGNYKIDKDTLKDEEEILEYFNLRKLDYKTFIPIFNIIKSVSSIIYYLKNNEEICDDLEDFGIIIPMARFEIYEFEKKPTIINLFKVLKKGRKRLLKANYFEAIDNNGLIEGQLYYEEDDNNVEILQTYGKFDEMIKSDIVDVISTNDEKGLFTNFVHDNGKTIFVAKNKLNKQGTDIKNLSNKEKIIELEELKRNLLISNKEEEYGKQKKIGRRN